MTLFAAEKPEVEACCAVGALACGARPSLTGDDRRAAVFGLIEVGAAAAPAGQVAEGA